MAIDKRGLGCEEELGLQATQVHDWRERGEQAGVKERESIAMWGGGAEQNTRGRVVLSEEENLMRKKKNT